MNLRIGININWFARLHGTAFQNIVPIFVSRFPQASDVGSIPIARSINLVDSVALPLLRLENGASWPEFWTQVGPKILSSRPAVVRLALTGHLSPSFRFVGCISG